jgi:hypothetical protein
MTKSLMQQITDDMCLSDMITWVYVGDKVKPTFVPFETLGFEMINKISAVNGSILVLSDCGLLAAILRKMKSEGINFSRVEFIAHTDRQVFFAEQVGVTTIHRLGYNEPIEILEQKMKKPFDIIVGNPPYLNGLHMDFLVMCERHLKDSGHLIFIQPSTEFIKQGSVKPTKALRAIQDKVKVIELRNPSTCFKDADLNNLVSITQIFDKTVSNGGKIRLIAEEFDSIVNFCDVSIHSHESGFFAFKNKIKSLTTEQSLNDITFYETGIQQLIDSDCKFFLKSSGIMGNTGGGSSLADFFKYDFNILFGNSATIVDKSQLQTKRAKIAWGFKTLAEAQSAYSYFRTNFVRASLSIYKNSLNMWIPQIKSIPVVPFDRTWTDEMLKEYFQLSEDECSYVDGMIKYYP